MMKALFREEGASLRIELLEEPEVVGFIDEHTGILDSSFDKMEMSDIMRARLRESNYIFSGIKTFHELNEAFPSLLDENGNRKPFNQFLNDVQKIDSTYNKAYLSAEYNHAQAAAEMAAKWEDFEEDGDEYNLQYRTAGDDKVRPEHAALHGVTLPMSDPFWDEYFPPNGWNCRCTVVQVLKDKYPTTDRAEAFRRGQEALAKDTKGIFHFNPGKQSKTFPDYNPYTISKCNTCSKKLNLAKGIADSELCDACLLVRAMAKDSVSMAAERVAEYDQKQWEHTYISERADGLVVIEHERIQESTKHPNEEEKFQKERSMCIDLADQGHDIQLFHGEGRPKGKTYDALFDGVPADLKCIDKGGSSIPKYAKHAFRDQGAEIVIYKLPSHDLYDKLKEAFRKYGSEGRILFYFADDTRLREIKK
ncbi:MAG: phage minor head protein [Candidatus Cryptobacteroides sp.]